VRAALAFAAGALLASACSASQPPAAAERTEPAAATRGAQEDCRARAAAKPNWRGQFKQVAELAGERPARVVDRAELLSPDTERALAARSQALEAATGDQVVVVTVAELGGLSVEEFGLALGNGWGIGRAEFDNGVLLLVAPRERRARLEVGCGLETLLTDARAADIMAKMTALFREGQFERGLSVGLGEVEALLRAHPERRSAD
jgi:uncharacterized membrane protein YgcG